jgi:hypothetical protein
MEASVFPLTALSTFHQTHSLRRRIAPLGLTLALASLILGVCFAGSAQAALISTGACNEAPLSHPFARWGDSNFYELAAGGDFESSATGWTLSGGAKVGTGGEPYGANSAVGSHSLVLPPGGSAQSPFTCVNASYPTFRFFARNNGLLSTVLVQVVYKTVFGTVSLPLGAVAPSGAWQPTLPMLTGSVVAGVLSGGTAHAALRFTAVTGTSDVDDVFVDPRMK